MPHIELVSGDLKMDEMQFLLPRSSESGRRAPSGAMLEIFITGTSRWKTLLYNVFLSHKTDYSDSGLGRPKAWIKVLKNYFEEETNTGQWQEGIFLHYAPIIIITLSLLACGRIWSLLSHMTYFLHQ